MTEIIDVEGEEVTGTELEVRRDAPPPAELGVEDLTAQVQKIQQVMRSVMKEGEHYGVIPGTGDKPSLLKPGAEKLAVTFRLAPSYGVERQWDDEHLTVFVTASLTHAPTGMFVGEGVGLCSTRESKYAERTARRVCPACGAAAIIKGKQEYGGGWLCWKKADPEAGCGEKFPDGAEVIEKQESGKVPNDKLADTYNTVIKMAKKRALVDAVLTATAASDIFAQDLEDLSKAKADEPETEKVGPPSTKKQTKELAALIDRLPAKPEGQEPVETDIRRYCVETFGTARPDRDDFDKLIEQVEKWVADQDLPFA